MSSNNVTSIKIRMYNTGSVGDCFLLQFQKAGNTTFNMMIDCGGIKTTSALVTPCVQDIKTACNGKLDLLIVTHQHEDHISGFNLARSVFDTIKVDQVWMSWVEDKSDPVAQILKKKYGKKLKELKKTTSLAVTALKQHNKHDGQVKGLKGAANARQKSMEQTLALLEFEEGMSQGRGLAGRLTNENAMDYVKGKGKSMQYRMPGEVLKNMSGAEGIKFYILGPPRDPDLKYLKIEMDEADMYSLATKDNKAETEQPNDERILQSGITLQKNSSPFGEAYKLSGKEKSQFLRKYNSSDQKWRQIETDWLDAGSEVALALTSLTNNTSLAMALEFENSGVVILLPADAQSGNWASWHRKEVMDSLKTKGGKNTDELLANTVFYKVGHHLSHNGTASKSGLDKMTNANLVAFAPLVQDKVPDAWGGADNFPAKALYKTIVNKTKGRVVRTDMGWVTDNNGQQLRNQLSADQQKQMQQSFKKGTCYFEYTING
jgi:chitodextrinase